jgi:hypothetical protein
MEIGHEKKEMASLIGHNVFVSFLAPLIARPFVLSGHLRSNTMDATKRDYAPKIKRRLKDLTTPTLLRLSSVSSPFALLSPLRSYKARSFISLMLKQHSSMLILECYMNMPDGYEMDVDDLRDRGKISNKDYQTVLSACEAHADRVHPDRNIFLPTPALRRHLVLALDKCIYGLHQASRGWAKHLNSILVGELGFQRSEVDPCLFSRIVDGRKFWLLVYVDDLIQIAFDDAAIRQFQDELDRHLKMKHMGPASFILGIEVLRTPDGSVTLHQQRYVREVARRFGFENAKSPKLPRQMRPHC